MRDFTFVKPRDLNELLSIKKEKGSQALILAGGTNLLVYIKDGVFKKGVIVDITGLEALQGIRRENDRVEIGSAVTISGLLDSELLKKPIPFIPEMMTDFANPLVRNTSTIGGNIADASPIADAAPLLLVLQAEIVAASTAGKRVIPIDAFFNNPGETALKPDEVIVRIRVPIPAQGEGKFVKLGLRRGTSCSVTSVAVWLETENGKVQDIRIALGGVAPKPVRARKTEAQFLGQALDSGNIEALAATVQEDICPITDVRGSAAYRREVSARILARAVRVCSGMEEA